MVELAGYIAEGAMAFLKAEWKILTYFCSRCRRYSWRGREHWLKLLRQLLRFHFLSVRYLARLPDISG